MALAVFTALTVSLHAQDNRDLPPVSEALRQRLNQELSDANAPQLPNSNTPQSPSNAIEQPSMVAPNVSIAPEIATPVEPSQALVLADVIASTFRAFPLLEIARQQETIARGEQRSAWGAWDTKIEYYSLNQPVGFYETYRQGLGVARQTWWGGYLSAGYRIGRGEFEPWYKERETNEGGEYKVAFAQPLLQGRAIDPQRVELFQSNLRRQAVGPEIQFQLLVATRDAAFAYWLWVEQGNVLRAQERLLQIALERGEQFELELKQKIGTQLKVSLNKQQILDRQMKVNDTQMKFRDSAYKLSLFLRDESGRPIVPPPEWLPGDFPAIQSISMAPLEQDYANALAARPELQQIELLRQEIRWEFELARNQTLPNLDFTIQAAQDTGARASSINDKGDFELESGLVGGVPIQRNKAFGKMESTRGKLNQLAQKLEWQRNKIGTELQMARNQVEFAERNVAAAQGLVAEARKVLEFFQLAFKSGDIETVFLLQQEVKVTESEVKLYEAQRDYFASVAALQASLGLDPLDQSNLLSQP